VTWLSQGGTAKPAHRLDAQHDQPLCVQTFCNNAGNYNFTGPDADCSLGADIQTRARKVHRPADLVGYSPPRTPAFRNMMIKDGRVRQPDVRGHFLDRTRQGDRPAALSGNMDKGKNAMSWAARFPIWRQ
jgi:hypothetical protein